MEVFIFVPARNDTFISNMPLHHSMGSRTAGIWICCLVKHHDIIPLLANCDIDKRALCLRLRICFYHVFFLKLKAFCQESLLATRLTVKAPWRIGDGVKNKQWRIWTSEATTIWGTCALRIPCCLILSNWKVYAVTPSADPYAPWFRWRINWRVH